jgi:flagellar L-ring protein precursor FlgH
MTGLSRPALALAAAALVAGCGTDPFDTQVEPSAVGTGVSQVETVQVPMPPPEPPRAEYRAERASLWGGGTSDGFFADQRAERVGDLLTIVIDIDDNASLRNETSRQREGSTNVGTPSIFGFGDQLTTLFTDGGGDGGDDVIALSAGQDISGSGEIDRNERINLRVAALVVQELPNGNLVVAGRQEVKVNQELRDLRVSGIIRPADIQRDNSIPYDKIAEARISYGGEGQLSRQTQVGYGEGLMNVVLPY